MKSTRCPSYYRQTPHCHRGKRVRSVGAVTEYPVDIKLSAATQADLGALVAHGRFWADLYCRLAVIRLAVPPPARHARGSPIPTY